MLQYVYVKIKGGNERVIMEKGMGQMKKGVGTLGAVGTMAVLGCLKKNKSKKEKMKYNFLSEFTKEDLRTMPAFLFAMPFIKLMNRQGRKKQGNVVDGIVKKALQIHSFDGKKIQIYVYEPEDCGKEEKPCLIYYHGGAFCLDYLSFYHEIASDYAKKANCKVVSVCYRTMATDTYRTSLYDCYQTLLWVYENAETLCIDRNRIAVGGDSAGGSFSAAVTHLTRDLGGPKICYQMLNYPSTSKSMEFKSMKKYADTPKWNSTLHKQFFSFIVPSIDDEMMPYFDLLAQNNFEGLCDAYVEVEEFDCLHDPGQQYAELLKKHGYEVFFNDVKGTFHAFDQMRGKEITKKMMTLRCEVLKKAFGENDERG